MAAPTTSGSPTFTNGFQTAGSLRGWKDGFPAVAVSIRSGAVVLSLTSHLPAGSIFAAFAAENSTAAVTTGINHDDAEDASRMPHWKKALLDRSADDLGCDGAEGQAEVLVGDFGEAGVLDDGTGVAVGMAAVADEFPERTDEILDAPQKSSRRCRDVLEEEKPSAGLEHPMYFPQDAFGIIDGAEHERAHDGVQAIVVGGKLFGRSRAEVHFQSGLLRRRLEVRDHVRIRLDAQPVNSGRIVGEIRAGAGADFENRVAEPGQQLALSVRDHPLVAVAEIPQHPGMNPRAETGVQLHASLPARCLLPSPHPSFGLPSLVYNSLYSRRKQEKIRSPGVGGDMVTAAGLASCTCYKEWR